MAESPHPTRRQIAAWFAVGGAALALGCRDADGGTTGLTGTTGATGDTGTAGRTGDTGTAPTDTGTPQSDTASVDGWATGGTAAMVAKASYPDPFEAPSAGDLMCSTTEGPCTSDTLEREDVSEGFPGLPMRLLLRVLDEDGTPLEGARVRIWHTQRTGVYSGVTPSGSFCYGDDPGAEAYLYFRGEQVADADGVVGFDSCFPGWYSSRVPHIHIQVVLDGTLHLTTQVVLDDLLCDTIYGTHPEYVDYGLPDTTVGTDTVVGGEDDPAAYLLETAQMTDGALLAWKTIRVRSDPTDPLCAAEGASGGGPGGGGPGGP